MQTTLRKLRVANFTLYKIMSDKQIDPFTNIAVAEQGIENQGTTFLSNLRSLSIGDGGTNVFRADRDGMFLGGETFDTAVFKVTMAGAVTATSISITGGTIKYGKTGFTDNAHDGYYIGSEGFYFGSVSDATKLKFTIATGVIDYVGNVSGRASSVLASAIDSSGHFIDGNLNTSAKTILADFSFGVSGALQIGTYQAGVSGDIRISPNGIIARNSAGANTIAINGSTGEITAFVLTAGSITGITITGGILQTSAATDVDRVIISGANNDIEFWNLENDLVAVIEPYYNIVNSMAGLNISAGGGTYFNLSGKGNMGFAGIGASGDADNDGNIVVTWDANDPTTIRLSLLSTIGGVTADLPIDADLIPYANDGYDLGTSAKKWKDAYFTGNIVVGGNVDGVDVSTFKSSYDTHVGNASAHHSSTSDGLNITPASVVCGGVIRPSTANSYDLGTSTYYWSSLYVDYVRFNSSYGQILWGSTVVCDFYNTYTIWQAHFDPYGAGSYNLGGSTRYWNDVSYKTLTDRGCLGWFDEGVELQDGRVVSDVEALEAIQKHPTQKTIYGKPRLDYKTMPKVVYKPAADHEGNILKRDKDDKPYAMVEVFDNGKSKMVKTPAEDGAETTALLSIMLGAIKELSKRIKELEAVNKK